MDRQGGEEGERKGGEEGRADRQSDGTDKQTTLKANPTVNKACGMRHKASHMYESVLEKRTYAMWTAIKCAICAINEPNKSRNRKRKKEKRREAKAKPWKAKVGRPKKTSIKN